MTDVERFYEGDVAVDGLGLDGGHFGDMLPGGRQPIGGEVEVTLPSQREAAVNLEVVSDFETKHGLGIVGVHGAGATADVVGRSTGYVGPVYGAL
jgi:hypothetical protein